MANTFSVNIKKILHSLGAVVDGAYLWAGADKGIQNEMQGKNNGSTIYYTISDFGDVGIGDLSATDGGSVSGFSQSANSVTQKNVAVGIKDARVCLETNAFERMLTSMGEIKARINIGQKLAKKAIKEILPTDISSIGNVFVGKDYKPYQLAGAYMKSYTDGKLYGFMDWQAWGVLTSQGQQAVPCNLARPEFGNQLVGKWSLIDELRVIPDIPTVDLTAVSSGAKVSSLAIKSVMDTATITITASNSLLANKTYMFQIEGLYNTDCNGSQAGLYTFTLKPSADTTSATITAPIGTMVPTAVSNAKVISLVSSDEEGTYAGCVIRAEGAQCFGTANDVSCKSAKYSKESYEGFTIHTNEDSDVLTFKDVKRWDLVFASKLIEPRAAALVLLKI